MVLTEIFDKRRYGGWDYNNEGPYKAIVLRYADCSLRCHLCYSQRYAYLETKKRTINRTIDQTIDDLWSIKKPLGWMRIQGGEPIQNDSRTIFTSRLLQPTLKYMKSYCAAYKDPRLIIQTNGLWFSTTSTNNLNEFVRSIDSALSSISRGRIIIEISIKGPNNQDADLYALSISSPYIPRNVLETQLEGYYKLKKALIKLWEKNQVRVALYPVAGLGAEINKPGFIPISSKSQESEYPLFHPKTWSHEYQDMVKDFSSMIEKWSNPYSDYRKRNRTKLPIEGFDNSKMQSGWISRLGKRKELAQFSDQCVRVNWKNINKKIYNRWIKDLEKLKEAKPDLLEKISDLNKIYYCAEPRTHYPYL